MISVLVVDDHPLFRRGLIKLLEEYSDLKVIGEASDGNEAVVKAIELQPTVVLMDVQMPRNSGIKATAEIVKALPQSRVILVTVSEKEDDLVDSLLAGARGYVLKFAEIDEVISAIKSVAAGDVVISTSMVTHMINHFHFTRENLGRRQNGSLSLREIEILRLVANGKSNKQIAKELNISQSTVKIHLHSIMNKLDVRNRAQAVVKAIDSKVLNE
jgi:DNA-binding NarL/FixJ family response regulator